MNGLAEFYQSDIGKMAHRFLRAQLQKLLSPAAAGDKVLILGFGVAYASELLADSGAQIILGYFNGMPPAAWPEPAAHQVCVVSPDALPFGDAAFDKVILIHALEFAPDAQRLMHEVQRVLNTQGQMISIAPKRGGLWSWFEHTPYGEGRTFSTRQMRRLLVDAQLSVLDIRAALFAPPVNFMKYEFTSSLAAGIENLCSLMGLRFGGAVIASAQKQRYAGTPIATHAYARKLRLHWAEVGAAQREEANV